MEWPSRKRNQRTKDGQPVLCCKCGKKPYWNGSVDSRILRKSKSVSIWGHTAPLGRNVGLPFANDNVSSWGLSPKYPRGPGPSFGYHPQILSCLVLLHLTITQSTDRLNNLSHLGWELCSHERTPSAVCSPCSEWVTAFSEGLVLVYKSWFRAPCGMNR